MKRRPYLRQCSCGGIRALVAAPLVEGFQELLDGLLLNHNCSMEGCPVAEYAAGNFASNVSASSRSRFDSTTINLVQFDYSSEGFATMRVPHAETEPVPHIPRHGRFGEDQPDAPARRAPARARPRCAGDRRTGRYAHRHRDPAHSAGWADRQ